jgi:hypothetical protein
MLRRKVIRSDCGAVNLRLRVATGSCGWEMNRLKKLKLSPSTSWKVQRHSESQAAPDPLLQVQGGYFERCGSTSRNPAAGGAVRLQWAPQRHGQLNILQTAPTATATVTNRTSDNGALQPRQCPCPAKSPILSAIASKSPPHRRRQAHQRRDTSHLRDVRVVTVSLVFCSIHGDSNCGPSSCQGLGALRSSRLGLSRQRTRLTCEFIPSDAHYSSLEPPIYRTDDLINTSGSYERHWRPDFTATLISNASINQHGQDHRQDRRSAGRRQILLTRVLPSKDSYGVFESERSPSPHGTCS